MFPRSLSGRGLLLVLYSAAVEAEVKVHTKDCNERNELEAAARSELNAGVASIVRTLKRVDESLKDGGRKMDATLEKVGTLATEVGELRGAVNARAEQAAQILRTANPPAASGE